MRNTLIYENHWLDASLTLSIRVGETDVICGVVMNSQESVDGQWAFMLKHHEINPVNCEFIKYGGLPLVQDGQLTLYVEKYETSAGEAFGVGSYELLLSFKGVGESKWRNPTPLGKIYNFYNADEVLRGSAD